MKTTKKDQGNAVKIILETAYESYCCVGEDDMQGIVNLLNSAYIVCAMWDLREIEKVRNCVDFYNNDLMEDNSKYRIIFDNLTYKLVTLV